MPAIVENRLKCSFEFLPERCRKNFTYYLEVSLLVVIKETTNFYMEFVLDVPVVPAGAIVLKYSITPILF